MKISECKVGMLVTSTVNPHFVWKITKVLKRTLHVETALNSDGSTVIFPTQHKMVDPKYLIMKEN